MSVAGIYIKDALFRSYPRNRSALSPRQRAVEFEEDLFDHAGKRLDWRTVTEGGGYSYTELGTPLLDDLKSKDMLDDVGGLVLAYWTPEYNPEYSAFGPYFVDTYVPGAHVADVCDRGSVCAFAALKLAHAQVLTETATRPLDQIRDVVVLGFEQTTITRDPAEYLPIPSQSSAGAVVVSAKVSERAGRLLDAGIEPESDLQEGRFCLTSLVESICARADVDPAGLVVLTPFDSFVAKHWRYRSRDRKAGFTMKWVPGGVSSMRVFEHMHGSLRSDLTREHSHALLIDEDVETLALGWSLFQGPRAWRKET